MILVEISFQIMIENLEGENSQVNLDKAKEIEYRINSNRDELREEHLSNIKTGDYASNIQGGLIYNDLFSSLEKIGDHVINVSEALAGKI